MTPERKEEIKQDFELNITHFEKGTSAYESSVFGLELLAALEETEQQVKNLKEDKRKIFAVHDEQCARSSEYYNELIFVKGKLKEEEQEKVEYKAESERLNEICRQLAGEEMLFQEGQYETEMQSLESRLAEAQQTIARLTKAMEWYADPDKHEIKRRLLGDYAPITLDKGEKAREALGEGAKES